MWKNFFKLLLSCSCLLFFNALYGQSDQELKSIADHLLDASKFQQALPLYLKLHKKNPLDTKSNFKIGYCYVNSPAEKHKAIPFLERALTDSMYRNFPLCHYYLGIAYHYN